MLEAERFLRDSVSDIDAVMEVLDARLPASSANPFLDRICRNVVRIKVLNKNDLADPEKTELWIDHLNNKKGSESGYTALAINGTDSSNAWRAVEEAVSKISIPKSRRARLMVAGIPNTGKSTIMNSLAGKKVAKTGNTPAVTRHKQRSSLKNKIDIYDTPGILWPILEEKRSSYILAASGAVADTAFDYSEIATFVIDYMVKRYPDAIMVRYNTGDLSEMDSISILEKIGSSRGCLKRGGIVDLNKSAELFIRELRAGKIGRITFEIPSDLFSGVADSPAISV